MKKLVYITLITVLILNMLGIIIFGLVMTGQMSSLIESRREPSALVIHTQAVTSAATAGINPAITMVTLMWMLNQNLLEPPEFLSFLKSSWAMGITAVFGILITILNAVPHLGGVSKVLLQRLPGIGLGVLTSVWIVGANGYTSTSSLLIASLTGFVAAFTASSSSTAFGGIIEGLSGGLARPIIELLEVMAIGAMLLLVFFFPFFAIIFLVIFTLIGITAYRYLRQKWQQIRSGEMFGSKHRDYTQLEKLLAAAAHLIPLASLVIWPVNYFIRFDNTQIEPSMYVSFQAVQALAAQIVLGVIVFTFFILPIGSFCFFVLAFLAMLFATVSCFLGREFRYPIIGTQIENLYLSRYLAEQSKNIIWE